MREKVSAGILQYVEGLSDINNQVVHDALILRALHREVELLVESHLTRQGVTPRQMDTLEALYHHPDHHLTPAALADLTLLTRSAMTSVLDGLEKKGLLQRGPHSSDRRMVMVSLTPEGVAYCDEHFPHRYADMERIVGCLSHQERTQMRAMYLKIIAAIRNMLEEGRAS